EVIKTVLRKEGEQLFKEFIANLSPSEIKVIKGLATSPGLSPIEISRREFIGDNSVNTSLNLLGKKGIIKKIERGKYEFTDNMFSEWLKSYNSL
ncbi:MAG: ATPase 2 protein, partial [Candidatus Nitrosotenuis sp.]|nr:ATPase 2 protein [Candidatus Nitrosotenuis sp.]